MDRFDSATLSDRQKRNLKLARAAARYRETLVNPFRRKRRANGETRYLNRRQEREHSSLYDIAGNPTV